MKELTKRSRIHFLGIGGIGVSAVARLCLELGHTVSGSDVRESAITKALVSSGASVHIGHRADNLIGAELVVVSTAIPETNQELIAARTAGIPVVHRSEILGALMARYRSVGVTGTNGKGSVSALISYFLDVSGQKPSFAIGAMLENYGINARIAEGKHLVAELDESDGSFTNTRPDILVINNLEADHLNYYKDLDGVLGTFSEYLARPTAPTGLHVLGDDPNIRKVLAESGHKAVKWGVGADNDYRLLDLWPEGMGYGFRATGPDGDLGEFHLPLPGAYNVRNTLGALSVALEEGADLETIRQALPAYKGLENRFTVIRVAKRLVVKDYISHPSGILSVLEGAKNFATGRIVAVFKPYRFTMIHYLQDEYRSAFVPADVTLITEMYTAGEVPIPGVDIEFLADKIRSSSSEVVLVPEMGDIIPKLHEISQVDDVIVFFGGDDLFRVADRFAEELAGRASQLQGA